MLRKFIAASLCLFAFYTSEAQQTWRYTEQLACIKDADIFYRQGLYSRSLLSLQKRDVSNSNHFRLTDFDYASVQWLELLNKIHLKQDQVIDSAIHFLASTPYEDIKQLGSYQLGMYLFQLGNYELSIALLEKSNILYLSNREISGRNFALAYAYLVSNKIEKVEPLLVSVKDILGEFHTPGNYYHGMLSYYQGNYDEARKSFKVVAEVPQYSSLVPFYLVEMDYLQGNTDKALKDGTNILSSNKPIEFQAELNQLIGHIYLEKHEYILAEKYLQACIQLSELNDANAYYKLAEAYMQQAKIAEAIQELEKGMRLQNVVEPFAYYQLGNLYLMKEEKLKASENFKKYQDINVSGLFKEEVSFCLAKLAVERNDVDPAIKQLNDFLIEYPASSLAKEAYDLLFFITIKNNRSDEALQVVKKSNDRDLKYKHQNFYINRAKVNLLANKSKEAIRDINLSLKQPIDEALSSESQYWLAEANFREQNYKDAILNADNFLDASSELNEERLNMQLLKAHAYLALQDSIKFSETISFIEMSNSSDSSKVFYTPKAALIPADVEAVIIQSPIFIYQIPTKAASITYSAVPLKPLSLKSLQHSIKFSNHLKLGLGNLNGRIVDAGLDISDILHFPTKVFYSHISQRGAIRNQQASQSQFTLMSKHLTKYVDVMPKFEINRRKVNYYGYDRTNYNFDNKDLKQVFTDIHVHTDVNLKINSSYRFSRDAKVGLGIFTDRYKALEPYFHVSAPLTKQINETVLVGLGLQAEASVLRIANSTTQRTSIISFQPFWRKQFQQSVLQIGLYPTLAKETTLLPNASYVTHLPRTNTQIELGVQSWIHANSFREMSRVNPFMFNDYNIRQTRHAELYTQATGNLMSNLTGQFRVGYDNVNNLPLFINDTASDFKQFRVLYDQRARLLKFAANLEYTLHANYLVGTRLQYNPVLQLKTYERAWGYLPLVWDIYGQIKLPREAMLRVNFMYRSGVQAIQLSNNVLSQGRLGSIFDANLSVNMPLATRWHLQLELNNILGIRYQRWYGYDNFHRNAMISVTHLFNKPKFITNNFFN